MARARVEIKEWSLDTRVPSFPGLYGGIVLPSLKGEVGKARLITNESDFLRNCTPDETIKVGYDSSHYSALAFLSKSNKLWVVRAANNPLYGGALFAQDPPFTSLDIYPNFGNNTFYIRTTTFIQKANAESFYAFARNKEKVNVASDTALPAGLNDSSIYYLFNLSESNGVYTFQLAFTEDDADNSIAVNFTDNGTGNITLMLSGTNTNKSLTKGLIDPFSYLMDSSDGKVANLSSEFTTDIERDSFQVSEAMYNLATTGDRINLSGIEFPVADTGAPLVAGIDYYVIKLVDLDGIQKEFQLARSVIDALNGVFIPISTIGSGLAIAFQDKESTSAATAFTATNDFSVSNAFYNACETGDTVNISSSVDDLPVPEIGDPFTSTTDYYIIKSASVNTVQLAISLINANNSIAIGLAGAGTNLTLSLASKESTGSTTPDLSNNKLSVDPTFLEWIESKNRVRLSTTGTLPSGLSANTDYYVIKGESIKLAISTEAVDIEEAIDITSPGTGIHTILNVTNEQLIGLEQNCLFIYGANPGAWNSNLYIKTVHYPYGDPSSWSANQQLAADTVKEPGCFLLYIYKKNPDKSITLVEDPHLCSRIKDKKDGYNNNVYVETALEASSYVRAIDNDTVDQNIYPKDQETIIMLNGGDDGGQVTDTHMLKALDALSNKRDIALTLLLDGGWTTPAFQKQGLLAVAANRKDCFAILTIPYAAENSSNYIYEITKYTRETLNADSTYGGIYSAHLLIQDKFNDRKVYVASDGYIGATISETAGNYEVWYVPAGSTRGKLDVLDTRRHFTEGEMDALADISVNPIEFRPGRGIRLWGQKTLTTTPKSLDRINVRLALIVIEPAVAEFLEDFLFDFNDALTRSLAESGISSYMENIKARKGVAAFRAKCDSENNSPEDIDANRMNLWLFVTPMKAVEEIQFTTIITRTGAEFKLG